VLARCGRPLIEVRDIHAVVAETPTGLPEARIDVGPTNLAVHRDSTGGLVVTITATTPDEADLTVTLNGRRLHPMGAS